MSEPLEDAYRALLEQRLPAQWKVTRYTSNTKANKASEKFYISYEFLLKIARYEFNIFQY